MPTPLILTEGGPAQTVALTGAEYRALNDLGIVTVTPTLLEQSVPAGHTLQVSFAK